MNKIITYLYILLIIIPLALIYCKKKKDPDTADMEIQKLEKQREICISDYFSPKGLKNARLLKEMAEEQKNDMYLGYAYKFMMTYYLNNEKEDSALYNGQKAKEYFIKTDNKALLINVETSLIEWEVNYGDPETALNKAYALLKETQNDKINELYTYELLGRIQLILNKPDKSLEMYDKVLELKKKNNIDLKTANPFIFLGMADAAKNAGKYKLSLQYCDSARFYINKYPGKNTSVLNILLNINLANNFIEMNRMKDAEKIIYELSAYYSDSTQTPRDKFYYYIQVVFSDYYFKEKQYSRSLQLINTALEKFNQVSDRENYNQAKIKKASILEAMGNYKEAFELRDKIKSSQDSINREQTIKQLNTLHKSFEKEKVKYQTEKSEIEVKYNRNLLLSLLTIGGLLLIGGIIIVYNYYKIKRKNEQIFLHYKDLDKYEEEIHKLSDLVKNSREKKTEFSLFEKAESFLQETESFLNPDISRDTLAAELGTNRQYLTQTIQENTGKTFMEYIYDMRLKHSRRLLTYQTDLPIEDIYILSGFNSKSTFYRLFKKKYDLTPNEMRELATLKKEVKSL